MRIVLGAAFGILVAASTALADDCDCIKVDVDIFDYPAGDLRDEPFMEEYPWEALSISSIPGKTSCQVEVALVYEDNPNLDSLPAGEYAHLEYILVSGKWQDFDDFEEAMRAAGCMPVAS